MHSHSPSWFVLSSEATANIHVESLVTAIVSTGLASCMVALRWYSRVCATSCGVKTEDYLVTAALVRLGKNLWIYAELDRYSRSVAPLSLVEVSDFVEVGRY